ncbi:MAG: Mrp/NBP35 family ATP-binding protein [Rikenellaceae bacterium]
MESKIRVLLDTITHPETGAGLHDGGFVDQITVKEERVTITLRFEKSRDPFASKLRRRVEELIRNSKQELGLSEVCGVMVMVKEGVAPRHAQPDLKSISGLGAVKRIVAIASGKGGVGKSTVTANLAATFQRMGYRVGVLDADIYGPSQAKMFGVEGFAPLATTDANGNDMISAAEAMGDGENPPIKVMSIGFFIKDSDPLMWRGAMASNALKQLLHQTEWGELDILLTDLPPGTGDIHLTILAEAKYDGAVIVSTPQGIALADVARGVEMFNHPKVNIPLLGMVENMAFFTPDDAPEKRYYIFGHGGASRYAAERGIALLGEVPIYESIMAGGESGTPAISSDPRVERCYSLIAATIVGELEG